MANCLSHTKITNLKCQQITPDNNINLVWPKLSFGICNQLKNNEWFSNNKSYFKIFFFITQKCKNKITILIHSRCIAICEIWYSIYRPVLENGFLLLAKKHAPPYMCFRFCNFFSEQICINDTFASSSVSSVSTQPSNGRVNTCALSVRRKSHNMFSKCSLCTMLCCTMFMMWYKFMCYVNVFLNFFNRHISTNANICNVNISSVWQCWNRKKRNNRHQNIN